MNQEDVTLNHVLKTVLLILVLGTVFGLVHCEMVIEPLSASLKPVARISSYITCIISTSSNILLLLVIFFTDWIVINILNFRIDKIRFLKATNASLKIFAGNEISKFILIWIFLYPVFKDTGPISDIHKIQHLVAVSGITILSSLSDLSFIVIAVVVFFLTIKENDLPTGQSLCSASILIILFGATMLI